LVTDFESGSEQRRKVWSFPKRRVQLAFNVITQSDLRQIWQFFSDRNGSYEEFDFYIPYQEYWYNEYLGTGPGDVFDLKSKNTDVATVTVYNDGAEVGYSFLEGGGQYGSDRIDLTVAATDGEVISADFYGQMKLTSRFEQDQLGFEIFTWLLYNNQINIVEAKEGS